MRKLYLQAPKTNVPSFTKEASRPIPLWDDASRWPEEIRREVHKQIPYISDYLPNVESTRMNEELGYAFGHIEVAGKSEIETKPGMEEFTGVRKVRIPFIVKERKMFPLDVLVTSEAHMLPLTERRLRQALFRPHMFDVTGTAPTDRSLMSQLYPPYRQNMAGMSGTSMSGDMQTTGKMASDSHGAPVARDEIRRRIEEALAPKKTATIPNSSNPKAPAGPTVKQITKTGSILEAIRDQVRPMDVTEVSPLLLGLVEKNASAKDAIHRIASFEFPSEEKVASNSAAPEADVFLIRANEDHTYTVKAASRAAWRPASATADRAELVRHFGAKVAQDVDTAGSAVLTGGPGEPEVTEPEALLITEPGTYKVMGLDGKELTGLVVPNLFDPTTGQRVPSTLFFNGSVTAYQPDVVGVAAGEMTAPPTGVDSGQGRSLFSDEHGPVMTVPLKVLGQIGGDFLVEKADGEQATVPAPPGAKFVPFGDAESVALLSSSEAVDALKKEGSVTVAIRAGAANDVELALEGYGVKVAGGRETYDFSGALFELAGMGVSVKVATDAIAESIAFRQTVRLQATPAVMFQPEVEKVAEGPFELRRILVKEAEEIQDPSSVDTVLSLGFLSSENCRTFVSYLPQLETTLSRMCELLIAARIGLKPLSAEPIEKVVRSMEEVIEGLKVMAFRNN